MNLPASVSSIARARRLPAVPPALVDKQIDRIATRRQQHKAVHAEAATLFLMRAAQLRIENLARKGGRRAQA